jgi:glycerol-3-phosphate dehydrogenase
MKLSVLGAGAWGTATLLEGAERERCLQRFLSYPMYRAYRTRTNRELRLFALSRA